MRAIDTNLLVRLLARDDRDQVQRAERYIQPGAWVSQLVLVETIWVLESVFDCDAKQIGLAIEMLLEHTQLVLQDPDVVRNALGAFEAKVKVGFSDCMIMAVAKKAGHTPIGTFDREFSTLDNVERV